LRIITLDLTQREEGRVAIKGGQIGFARFSGVGNPLVLLPGSFSDETQFFPLIEEIIEECERDFPIIVIEHRGHGKSWPPIKRGSIEKLGQDVLHVLDYLHINRFFIGGHSIGGMIALDIGMKSPERVMGIISVEGWTNYKAMKDAYHGIIYNTLTESQEQKRKEERERVLKNWNSRQIKHFGSLWKKWDGSDFLRRTDLSILEIYGDRGANPPSLAQLHIPDRPNIQLKIIQNGSHSLPLQYPKELAKYINEFLSKNLS
jgi:3-oxoadipate enol-lactonase